MSERTPGYYWIDWTDRADADLVESRPGPLVGQWDGKVWWFARLQAYRFDCEVKVLGERIASPVTLAPLKQGAA